MRLVGALSQGTALLVHAATFRGLGWLTCCNVGDGLREE